MEVVNDGAKSKEVEEIDSLESESKAKEALHQLLELLTIFRLTLQTVKVGKVNQLCMSFLEYLLLPKGKPFDDKMVVVTKGCRIGFEEEPQMKKEDPECFNIPVTIMDFYLGEMMSDLGSSANMISLSLFKKIGGLELKRAMQE